MAEWNNPPETLVVWIFYQSGDLAFIYGVSGCATGGIIADIELDFDDDQFENGDGDYMCSAKFQKAQVGELGMVEIAAHWELDVIAFRSIDQMEQSI